MTTTFVALAMNLVFLREQGVLKRLRGTPLPSGNYLAALAAHAVTNTAIQLTIVIGAGALLFGVGLPAGLAHARDVRRGRRRSASPRWASRCRTRSRTSTPRRPTSTRSSCRSSSSAASSTTPRTRPPFLRDIAQALPLTHLIDGLSAAMVTGAAFADHLDDLAVVLDLGACSGSCSRCAGSAGRRGGAEVSVRSGGVSTLLRLRTHRRHDRPAGVAQRAAPALRASAARRQRRSAHRAVAHPPTTNAGGGSPSRHRDRPSAPASHSARSSPKTTTSSARSPWRW